MNAFFREIIFPLRKIPFSLQKPVNAFFREIIFPILTEFELVQLTSVWDLESSAVKFSLLIKKIASNFEDSIPSGNRTRIAGLEVSHACHCTNNAG